MKVLLSFILLLLLASCQHGVKDHSDHGREPASLSLTNEEMAELDDKFNRIFRELMQDYKANPSGFAQQLQGHEVDPFNRTAILVLKRSFYYLNQLDIKLDQLHKDCIEKRKSDVNAVCESIMDDENYSKLWASRIINERQKGQLYYFYMRMLDIADGYENSKMAFTDETRALVAQYTDSEAVALAKEFVGIWNNNLDSLLRPSSLQDPANFDLVAEVYELREEAIESWLELAEERSYNKKVLSTEHPDFVNFYQREAQVRLMYRGSRLLQESTQERQDLDALYEPVVEAIETSIEDSKRSPDSLAWKNHNGSKFAKDEWALTYDDGPKNKTTKAIIDLLVGKGWHATFFWLAQNVSSNSDSVKYAIKYGMGLAHHSYTHANLSKASNNKLDKEIVAAQAELERVYTSNNGGKAIKVNYFRAPYGAGIKKSGVQSRITSSNMEHFFWNVDTLDWKSSTPQQIYDRTKKQMDNQGRGIILFHDIHQRTVETTELMIKNLPNLKVVPLGPRGNNGILQVVNTAGAVSNPQPVAPVQPLTFPHQRTILTTTLNVRVVTTTSGNTPCGKFAKGDTVTVVRQDSSTGWFLVDITKTPPQANSPQPVCQSGKAWISGGSQYTTKK